MASKETPGGGGGGYEKRRTKDDIACAACKWQRRRCVRDCPLRPYFPGDKPEQFTRVRDLYGVTKVTKTLKELPLKQRDDYMKGIIFHALVRAKYPVYGIKQLECDLLHQISLAEAELYHSRNLLHYYRASAAAAAANNTVAATENNYATTVVNNPVDALVPVATKNYFPGVSADGTIDFISEEGYFGNFANGNETTPLEGTENQARRQRQEQHGGGVEDLRTRYLLDPIDSSAFSAASAAETLKRTAAAAFNPVESEALNPYAATAFCNPYPNTTINNNHYYYPGSISADGGTNDSFPGGGYFGNFREEEEEARPFKKNQAQQQQFLDDSNGLDLFPTRGNASFDNNENATDFLPDNAYAIESPKNDERATSMQKDDGNPFL
ncbi:unnamed protein product [Cochlearia groenlandica]